MIYPKKGISYRAVAVDTASPGKLILMLFDGALRFLTQAEHGFDEESIAIRNETICNNLIKAQNIVMELQRCLNLRDGGEFAERMFALYDFMISRLTEANMKKEVENVKVVKKLLGEIRDAWAEMLANQEGAPNASETGLSMTA